MFFLNPIKALCWFEKSKFKCLELILSITISDIHPIAYDSDRKSAVFPSTSKTAKLMGKSRDEYKDVTKQMSVETDKF
jgi:hypothetical protein